MSFGSTCSPKLIIAGLSDNSTISFPTYVSHLEGVDRQLSRLTKTTNHTRHRPHHRLRRLIKTHASLVLRHPQRVERLLAPSTMTRIPMTPINIMKQLLTLAERIFLQLLTRIPALISRVRRRGSLFPHVADDHYVCSALQVLDA